MSAFLLSASKKGISAHQMHRMIGVTYKSAWFMMHRLREAMAPGKKPGPLGGEGKIVGSRYHLCWRQGEEQTMLIRLTPIPTTCRAAIYPDRGCVGADVP